MENLNKDYNRINNLVGWICAIIATTVYTLTLERTTSWWDTGEFIAAAYKLQIVHQPGAPLFLMLQNVFSNLAMGNPERIAFWMNMGSAISSGLTILFLFWTITALARKVVIKKGEAVDQASLIKIMGAGAVGALAYTFSDTFWFSAVESEVYAMSSLCTAVVFWAIFKWEARADEPDSNKWLLFIAYIMGLSIGVHLLNLLAIPALALVIYFRKTANPTSGGAIKALLIGCVIVAVILWGVIQYLLKIAAQFDLFFVNTLGLGFGTGVIVFAILLVGATVYGIIYSIRNAKPLLNVVLLSFSLIVFGYSSFAMVLIRAKADTTLNNSDPDNVFAFLSYLNREQYGNEPKFMGPYFDSRPVEMVEGSVSYRKGEKKYEVSGRSFDYKFDRETVFPRIYSYREQHHQDFYREYLGLGPEEKPTFAHNLNFFFSYQVGHMYGRYFLWNFVGRQNDQQGHGDFTTGNWVSGIKPIDNLRLGGQYNLPESQLTDPSYNKFYFLPLILGLLGAVWHFNRRQRDAGVVGLLFFFTGLAIVLYLNQSPLQPRERDYAYAGSFYAFAIWIGLGVLAIQEWMQRVVNAKNAAIIASAIGLLMAPVLMAKEGWDDHDRSEKYAARDLARNYLESCAPNAILFSYGDNDTYPLWYAQEVEGIRPDVRVVNLSLLSADWYVRQMTRKVNEAEALPINIPEHKYVKGVRDVIYFKDAGIPGHVDVDKVVALMLSDNPSDKVRIYSENPENFLATKNLQLQINKEDVIRHNAVPEKWHDSIVDTMRWTYNRDYVSRTELAILDILANNNWERPIYFAVTVPSEHYLGLNKYLVSEGFTLRLMPVAVESGDEGDMPVNTDVLYNSIKHKYTWGNMKGSKYLDPESYNMLSMIRNSIYSATAEGLLAEGRVDEAREVLQNGIDSLPERIFRMRDAYTYNFFINNLYEVGMVDQATHFVDLNLKYVTEYLDYYFAIAETKPNLESENIQFGLYILGQLSDIAKNHGQDETHNRIEQILERFHKRIMGR